MPYSCPISGKNTPLNLSVPTSRETTPPIALESPVSFNKETTIQPSSINISKKNSFYIFDDDDDDDDENNSLQPKQLNENRNTPHPSPPAPHTSSPIKRASSVRKDPGAGISKISLNLQEILKFPKESTHAYSYAHLSPNSLAVRLSILKRSLEILLDRPDLIDGGKTSGLNIDIESFIHQMQDEDQQENKGLNIRNNASSAALAALFNSSMNSSTSSSNLKQDKNVGLKALIDILKDGNITSNSTKKNLAQNLHDLSLSSASTNSQTESELKINLLHALATPFYEPIVQTPIISLNSGASTLALSSLESSQISTNNNNINPNGPKRLFHTVSQKNTSPQAVFTVDILDPWNIKAANDLACLIFGVSRTSLRRLTLLDLISPDSRDFVLNKLIANSLTKNEIIFSGDIIAIAKPGNNLTWASLWAKKKGNLIICMFDQVPCDCIDVIIDLKTDDIINWKKISGNNDIFGDKIDKISSLIWKFDDFLTNERSKEINANIPETILESQIINSRRYFTISKNGLNIPCAITSKIIDENESKLKLKIHSLPYIAGVFILSSKDFKILSFNQSISKNLFGFNESNLINQSITKIIPNFIKIVQYILKNYPNLKLIPGLVLPEHFFRQVNSILNPESPSFLNSIGLEGKHFDGSAINIDIQLRCSTIDTLVLWITHSRTVYSNKLTGKKVRIQVEEEDRELPSQLSILDENEIQSISRSSSMRSTLHSSPMSTISSKGSSSDFKSIIIKEENESTPVDLSNFKVLDKTMDEGKLLKIENETIERHKSLSTQYPKTIGLKRRIKTFKEFKVLKKMGQGAYGRVVLAENIQDPNYVVVIKLIIKERILVDTWVRDRKLGTIPSEIQVMSTLNNNPHPNIMRLIDFFEDDEYYYIETPQHGFPSPGIDLFDLIELKKSMSEEEIKSILKQVVSALNHLHNNGIVHRDIKDENLIIDSNGVIKLIDFGSAAYVKQGPFDVFVGTLDYAAPEVLNGKSYEGKPQDVWSLGILIYTLIYKENPFYNVDEIMEGELNIPFVLSDGSVDLIKKILQRDIRKRPKMNEVILDGWLQSQ